MVINIVRHRWHKARAAAPWLWPAAIVLSALAAGLVVFSAPASPLRPAITLWFLLICPGMAFVRLLRVNDHVAELMLAIALSLALDALVAGAMLYAKVWSPSAGLGVLLAMSLVGAALQLIAAWRAPAQGEKQP